MIRGKLKRSLGWVEAGFYLSGLALLSVFFLLRFEGEQQREAGIAAFHAAAGARAESQEVVLAAPTDSLGPADGIATNIAAPNQELWAENRIRDYEASLEADASPPLAVLTIDKLDIQVPVYDGTDEIQLNRGVGRIEGTAAVDADGNLGIAGHRDGFFRGLKDIQIGDDFDLMTLAGTGKYRVTSIDIVDPSDVWVLAPTEEKTITLVTCYPFYYVGHAPKRFIVKATAEHFLAN